jgi:rod shape-determining protein MreD
MDQNRLLRPILADAFYIIILAMIQVTFTAHAEILGVRPDLTLVLAILTGYLFGLGDGIGVGLAAGFFRDMLAGRSLGLGMLLLMGAGIAGHFLLRDFFRRRVWMGLLSVFLITCLFECVLAGLDWFLPMLPDQIPTWSVLAGRLLWKLPAQGLINALTAGPLLFLLRRFGPYDPKAQREDLDDGSTGEGQWHMI